MNTKPEALRLADELEKYVEVATAIAAVAELRRLHSLNAELLEALKKILPLAEASVMQPSLEVDILDAHAAIAKVEGKQ